MEQMPFIPFSVPTIGKEEIDEVIKTRKKPVIYTRNAKRHWRDITGCEADSAQTNCKTFSQIINNPLRPIPLWDVETGDADLDKFQPYGQWTERAGRQYKLDANLFGLPPSRTVDLNVFDVSLFSPARNVVRGKSGRGR